MCGEQLAGVEKIVQKYRNIKSIKFTGFVNPNDYYEMAHVSVLPTLSEGFGRTIIESMSYGLPVISTPAVRDIISHGENGIIVPYKDSNAMAIWLKKLYADHEYCIKIGQEAAVSSKKYTWRNYNSSILNAIEQIQAIEG